MRKIELFKDREYEKGFLVAGSTHEEGFVGEIHWGYKQEQCEWQLAQWASKYNIAEGVQTKDECYETPSQTVERYKQDEKVILKLELRASEEYDSPRTAGQSWPHLLLEQSLKDRCPTLDQLSSLEFSSEVKVGYCECRMKEMDKALHTAQANLFLTIQHIESGDMYWFGIPYYDYRYPVQEAFIAEDGGKEDASHKLIYIIPQKRLTDKSFGDFNWITYQRDIYPDILEGLKLGKEKGFLETDDCSKYQITSMNFGWEMPGTFDASLYIRKLTLIGRQIIC